MSSAGSVAASKRWTRIPAPHSSFLDTAHGKIVGLAKWYYWEIDLRTGAFSAEDLESEFRKQKVDVFPRGAWACLDDHYYFVSEYLENPGDDNWLEYKSIGAFNRRTKNIDWVHVFDLLSSSGFQLMKPIVTDTHLLVMDNRNNLYIFKKQD